MTDTRTPIRVASVDEADLGLSSLDGGEFEVVDVEDAAACLDTVEAREIDCVVSEATLPETDPIDLFERLRADHPDLPFVLLAQEVGEEALREAIEAGVTDYVPADVAPETLGRRLRERVAEREAAERYHSLFEASPSPMVLVDTDGTIVSCNEACREFVGVASVEALQGEQLLEFVHPEDRELVERRMARVIEEGRALEETEVRVQRPDGEVRHVRGAMAPGHSGGEPIVQATFVDVTDLRRTEEEWSETAERYHNLVEASPAPINVFDASGEVLYCNEALRELVGVEDREAIVDRSIFEFIDPEDRETAEAELREVVEEKRSTGPTQMRVVTEDGEERDIQVATAPGRYQGEDVGQAVITDVTALRRTERALAETAERYRNLVEGAPVPIALVDEAGDIVLGNGALRDLLGLGADEELLGRSMIEFAVGDDRDRSRARLDRVIQQQERAGRTQMEIERCDGERRHVQVATTPGRYEDQPVGQVVLTDVTDLRETERELREERRFVEDALDALQDVFYLIDTEGEVVRWNERAVEVTGYTAEELAEMSLYELFVGDDLERVLESFQRVLAEGSDVVEAQLLTKGGETIPFEFRGQRLTDAEGEVEGIVGIGRDITDRRAWEREIAYQQERLEVLNTTNEIVRDVNAALVTARTREQIERTVCERFAGEGPYRFAWIGAPDRGHHRIVPRTWAGVERGYLDTHEVTLDESSTGQGPAGLAVRTGEVQAMSVHDPAFEPWREEAKSRGYESVVGIPITYDEVTYGVLVLYGDRAEGLEYLEEDVLGELGRTIGYAINAAERKRALLADSVVELDLSVRDSTEFFCRFSDALDCPITLEKVTPRNDGTYSVFLTVGTDDVDRVDEVCRQFQSITACKHLTDHDGEQTVELQVTETLVVDLLATHGSVVGSLTAEDGTCELTAELPSTGDVRSLVETLQSTYSGVELLARRERSGQERPQLGLSLEELLTDRQQEVLETAYFAGYFEESRASSGTEIAELLGISGPTFHHHLRTSHRRLLAELLGPRND